MALGPLWHVGLCGTWASVALGPLWHLGLCGTWASVARGPLWHVGSWGNWSGTGSTSRSPEGRRERVGSLIVLASYNLYYKE